MLVCVASSWLPVSRADDAVSRDPRWPSPGELERREQVYVSELRPLMARLCDPCHSGDRIEAEIDFSSFARLDDIQRSPRIWLRVEEMLRSEQMPPRRAKQPSVSERASLLAWVQGFLKHEAAARRGDPGRVVLRRLSNAEYTFTVRDLTGISTLDPAREFPVDGAAGEGFTNTGDALVMSPALVSKYLDAAREISRHAVLLPDGVEFSPHASRRDWTDHRIAEIRALYARFSDPRGGSDVNLQGIRFATNEGGRLPLAQYLLALLESREALRDAALSFDELARIRGLSAKYLRLLWSRLEGEDDVPRGLFDELSERWRSTRAESISELVDWIESWQRALWRFHSIGHIGRANGPTAWLEAVRPVEERREFRVELDPASRGDLLVSLHVSDAGDGSANDLVVWRRPRLEGGGRDPLLLRDLDTLARRLAGWRAAFLGSTRRYLEAISEAGLGFEASDAEISIAEISVAEISVAEIEALAARTALDVPGLRIWLDLLDVPSGGPVEVSGHFTERLRNGGGHSFINGWGSNETPSILANSSDEPVRIPGHARPRSIFVHPSPTLFVAVSWQSPVSGVVSVEAEIADAHPECGNGVEWSIEHRTRRGTSSLGEGLIGTAGATRSAPVTVAVRAGELVSLLIAPRDGNHSCDLTTIQLLITETGGEKRSWNLASELSGDILAGNPHADAHGNPGVWHLCRGEWASARATRKSPPSAPADSLLADWREARDSATRAGIAERIEALVVGPPLESAGSPDAILRRLVHDAIAAVDPPSSTDPPAPDPRFGRHPLGHEVDPVDLVVNAPSTLEFRVPAALAAGRALVVTGELDPRAGHEGTVQLDVTVQADLTTPAELTTSAEVTKEGASSPRLAAGRPVLAIAGSDARVRVERDFDAFGRLFPAALCYEKIVPVDEVVTLRILYREDDHLKHLLLDDETSAELDRLWDELFFVSREPLELVVSLEQIIEFATQDRPDLVTDFAPLRAPIDARAAEFRRRLVESEPAQLESVVEFASRAWRRPLEEADRAALRDLYQDLRAKEIAHEEAIRLLVTRVLVAPRFLYRLETPPPGVASAPVSDHELASRLSYFLWSSAPDAGLREFADEGRLSEDVVLVAQARRLLDHEFARRLAVEFACQWIHVRGFDLDDDKNERLFPEFAALRADMYEETVRFFEDLFRRDGSVLSVVDAEHTFLNERLARHYGIEAVEGTEWRRVDGVRAHGRGGVLAMASVLAKQSGASRSSPILRGNWVFETLLGERLPRPPAGVPTLPETVPAGLTTRELIEQHTAVAECARCHARIDPYGFALEGYDAIGRRRPGATDTRATLPDGRQIDGIEGLREYLTGPRREDLVRQFARKLLGYALGRELTLPDEPWLEETLARLEENEYRVSVLVESIVLSPQFRRIRGADVANED